MSQRTKKYLLVSMIALMIGAGMIVGCVSQQAQTNQKTDAEGATTINTNPEVLWGDSQWYNPIGKAYDTSFKIPERYALRPYQAGNGKYIPRSLALTTPELKPLPEEKQACREITQLTAECLSNVMEVTFGVDFSVKTQKTNGVNEINYLNYFKKDPKGVIGSLKWDYYAPIEKQVYGFNEVYYLDLEKFNENNIGRAVPTQERDTFFKYDQDGNVMTHVRCLARGIKGGWIQYSGYKELIPATCEHMFIVKELKMGLNLTYERQYLPQWQQIQNSVTNLINQFHNAATAEQRGK